MNFLRVVPMILRGIKTIPVSCVTLNSAKNVSSAVFATSSLRPFTRSLWYLTPNNKEVGGTGKLHHVEGLSKTCSCGCSAAALHTKGDKDLVEFLEKEIVTEKKSVKTLDKVAIKDYEIKTDGSDVTLTRKLNDEVITIKLNVNHTVDDGVQDAYNETKENQELAELTSKPNFSVEITKGKSTLAFACVYSSQNFGEEANNTDLFTIEELSVHDGEWEDTTYSVSGEIIDGTLYDLLMDYLDERGINSDFVEGLSEYCTVYEHGLYVQLLEKIKDFAATK